MAAAQCDGCQFWFHKPCGEISEDFYNCLKNQNDKFQIAWWCTRCAVSLHKYTQKVNALAIQNEMMARELAELKGIVSTVEETTDEIKTTQSTIVAEQTQLKDDHTVLKAKVDNLSEISVTDEELEDRLSRISNIIIHNLPESKKPEAADRWKNDKEKVENLCRNVLHVNNVNVENVLRLGNGKSGKSNDNKSPCPLRVTFSQRSMRDKVLKSSGALKDHNGEFKSISIREDRTPFQRDRMRFLVKEVQRMQEEADRNGEDKVWKVRKGRIVEMKRRKERTDEGQD